MILGRILFENEEENMKSSVMMASYLRIKKYIPKIQAYWTIRDTKLLGVIVESALNGLKAAGVVFRRRRLLRLETYPNETTTAIKFHFPTMSQNSQ